jgi:hypothetical protein
MVDGGWWMEKTGKPARLWRRGRRQQTSLSSPSTIHHPPSTIHAEKVALHLREVFW